MYTVSFAQPITKLDKSKGGYYFLAISAADVARFSRQKETRLICTLDEKVSFRCGLNPMGDGSFFVIVATRYVKALKKEDGSAVEVRLEEDPDPLGVDVPEVLQALLAQDPALQEAYDGYTDGQKRSLIHSIARVKDVDAQVKTLLGFFQRGGRIAYQRNR